MRDVLLLYCVSQTVPNFVLCFRGRKQTYNGPTMVSVVLFLQLVIDLDLTSLCWVTVIYFCSPEEDIWPGSPIVALPHTGYDQTKVTNQCLLFNLKFNQSQLAKEMNVLLIWALVTHSVCEPCGNQWFTIVCAMLVLYPEGSIDGADLSEIDVRLQALQDYMRDLDTGH